MDDTKDTVTAGTGSCDESASGGPTPHGSPIAAANHSPSTEYRLCRICSDKSDGAHFGVDSCRACAAFFRRSIVLKKKYVCRQGGNECNINKSVRCMCRKCRFFKCLHAGMLPENVHQRPLPPCGSDSLPPEPSSLFLSPSTSQQGPSLIHSDSTRSDDIVRPLPIRPPFGVELFPLLQRVFTNYTQMTALRHTSEVALSPNTCLRTIFGDKYGENGRPEDLHPCNFVLFTRMIKAAVPIVADFCNSTFPEFASLDHDDKWQLFRNFIGLLFHFECAFRTAKNMPTDWNKRQVTVTTYIDCLKMNDFFNGDNSFRVDSSVVDHCAEKSTDSIAVQLHNAFKQLDMTDIEMAAFVTLMLWTPTIANIPEGIHDTCASLRNTVFKEIHNYYRSVRQLDDYALRLGEFMSLFATMQATTQRMREEMEVLSLFDLFEKDSFIYHLLRT